MVLYIEYKIQPKSCKHAISLTKRMKYGATVTKAMSLSSGGGEREKTTPNTVSIQSTLVYRACYKQYAYHV